MSTITFPKIKYQDIKKKADAYELISDIERVKQKVPFLFPSRGANTRKNVAFILSILEKDFFTVPPVKDSKKIIGEFKKTGLYKKEFIESLKKGLSRSSYFLCQTKLLTG